MSRQPGKSDLDTDSSSSSEDEAPRLADHMTKLFIVSDFDRDGRDFLPVTSLDSVVTEGHIIEELKATDGKGKKDIDDIVQFILEHDYAKKFFAIIASLGLDKPRKMMKSLMDSAEELGLDDRCLPIDDPRCQDSGLPHTLRLSSLGKGKVWKEDHIGRFYREQWRFLAPVFQSANEIHNSYQDFKAPCIMPFINRYDDDDSASKGAFGSVTKCKIHPDHLLDLAHPVSPGLAKDVAQMPTLLIFCIGATMDGVRGGQGDAKQD